jgi:hypothetical protein
VAGNVDLNYLDELGERIRARVPRSELPEEDTRTLFRIYAVLLLAKGTEVTAADVHNAWAAWMLQINPSHDAIVPYMELEGDLAAGDLPYVEAIRAVAGTAE